MFTIKHIENNGYESIIEARTVSYHYPTEDQPVAEVTAFYVPGEIDGYCRFASGRIYVMNEAGKTVADYNLYSLNKR